MVSMEVAVMVTEEMVNNMTAAGTRGVTSSETNKLCLLLHGLTSRHVAVQMKKLA